LALASFSPDTGLLYVGSNRTFSVYYSPIPILGPKAGAVSTGGRRRKAARLLAIDYKTGKITWRTTGPAAVAWLPMLSTAGKLLFTSNGNNFIAFDPTNGKILWHAGLTATPSNGPMTYMSTANRRARRRRRYFVHFRFELKPLVRLVARSRDLIKMDNRRPISRSPAARLRTAKPPGESF